MKKQFFASQPSMRAQPTGAGLSRRRLLAGAAGVATASAIRFDAAPTGTAGAAPTAQDNADEHDDRRRRLAALLERHGAEFGARS